MDPVSREMTECYTGQRQCYGIDVEGTRIVIARASRTRRGVSSEIVYEADGMADATSLASWTTRIQAEAEVGRACLVAVMPVAASFVRWLQTPFTSRKKAAKVLPSLLDVQLPCPLEKCVYGFILGQGHGKEVGATALAARREDIDRRSAELKSVGIEPDGLDHEGLALLRYSLRDLEAGDSEVRVVAAVGNSRSTFVVGDREGMRSAHAAQVGAEELFGADPVVKEAARRRYLQRAQQVLRTALAGQHPVPLQWMWVGSGAENRQQIGELELELQQEGVRFDVHKEPGRFLARALAELPMAAPGGGSNFLSDTFEHRRVARRRRQREVAMTVVALATGALLCAANLVWRAALDRRKAALQGEVTATTAELTGMPLGSAKAIRGQEVRVVREELAKRTSFNTAFLDVFGPSLTDPLSRILSSASAQGVDVATLTLGHDRIEVAGTARSMAGCDALEKVIGATGYDITADLQEGADGVSFAFKGRRAR